MLGNEEGEEFGPWRELLVEQAADEFAGPGAAGFTRMDDRHARRTEPSGNGR